MPGNRTEDLVIHVQPATAGGDADMFPGHDPDTDTTGEEPGDGLD